MSYTVYILQCNDNSLYTGIAKDADKRLKKHNSGKGSRYVAARCPAQIVYRELAESRSAALVREIAIKKLSSTQKRLLVSSYQQKITQGNET